MPRLPRAAGIRLAVLAVAALAVFAASRLVATTGAGGIPTNPAFEQALGVRLTQLAVSADGGLVDVRFLVLDPTKASDLTRTPSSVPRLVVESTGEVIQSAALMGAKHDLRAGRTSFLLYRNTGGAIRRGTLVSIVFADLKVEHVVAQ
jgi:hypothetical protein